MKMSKGIVDDLLYLLFPRLCNGCFDHLMANEKLICTQCLTNIPVPSLWSTPGSEVEKMFWGRCKTENVISLSSYSAGTPVQNIIHRLKYKEIKELGPFLGAFFGKKMLKLEWVETVDAIVAVPLHPDKERKRGFNQSDLIAEGISEITGIPIYSDVIERVSSTGTQTLRGRYDRWVNVEGLFRLRDGERIRGKHILLVDDVITTGATIEACVNCFSGVDGLRVSIASIAATLD